MPKVPEIDLKKITKLGVIAGAGFLPKHVVDACKKKKIPFTVVCLEGETDMEQFKSVEHEVFQVHKVSKLFAYLKNSGVTHVTLAGKVKRADISRLLLDLKGAKLFAMIVKNGLADNSILMTIMKFIESQGFEIIAPEKIADELILPKGDLAKTKPSKQALSDIKNGVKTLKGVAGFDVGQALVIQNGLVLGVEAAEGTDELIKRCGEIKQEGEGPVLIKIIKPHQDKRVDMPCIGGKTIENAAKYGVAGIAAEAGSTLVLNSKEAIELANKHKIFIHGF